MSARVPSNTAGDLRVAISEAGHQTRVDWTLSSPGGQRQAGVFHCCRHRLFGLGPLLTFYVGRRPPGLSLRFTCRGAPRPERVGGGQLLVSPPA